MISNKEVIQSITKKLRSCIRQNAEDIREFEERKERGVLTVKESEELIWTRGFVEAQKWCLKYIKHIQGGKRPKCEYYSDEIPQRKK
jgi:hypothetical protein